MNFYEAQDDARKRTKLLVCYFVLAVLGVVFAIYSILSVYYSMHAVRAVDAMGNAVLEPNDFWDLERFLTVTLLTSGVIVAGTLFKSLQLSGGGSVVARDMGGRQVDPNTQDREERKLINVVEEMAIASGTPVPEIWVMDHEAGINAFAAGTEPSNAVIGVTRGCIQQLTRSELQGVIAHEFSHILNGDMKLNMRLIGWLFGIMMLSIIGRQILFQMQFARLRGSRDNNNGALIGLVAAISLIIVGAIGVFFARMIQAAISRQREYLADASAVQFTRDPSGIAGALKKIGGQQYGSNVESGNASEASHMFFADGGMFSYGFATHPPLDVRIRAIEGDWDGAFEESANTQMGSASADQRVSGFASGNVASSSAFDAPSDQQLSSHVSLEQWAQLGDASQMQAHLGGAILSTLEKKWVEACRDRSSAQALIFGLLLPKQHARESAYLKKAVGDSVTAEAEVWASALRDQHSTHKIALIDLSMPTLRKLSHPEHKQFLNTVGWLITSDGQVDIFEFMLQKLLQSHLTQEHKDIHATQVRYHKMSQLNVGLNRLISTMAGIGAETEQELQQAYQKAADELNESGAALHGILPPEECGLHLIDEALSQLANATPVIKRDVLYACGLAVMSDGVLGNQEIELLRATADSIGMSLPPMIQP